MRTLILIVLLGVVGIAAADHKYGRQVRYVGTHPIPKSDGGGICYIEGPHVHIYATNKVEYRVHGDDNIFVGDPVAHGWDGPKYTYKGPHPMRIEGDPDEEYCYIEGPHYHSWQPPEGPDFEVVGGAYFYVGTPPHAMIEARPAYVGINAYYQPLVYTRPVVEVEPPHAWIGMRADVWGPGVVVGAPGVVVETPGVVVGAPGAVIVGKHGRAVVGGGAVVEGGIGIAVPAPSVHVGVGIGVGGGAVVGPAPVIIRGRGENDQGENHDNGRHEGWRKGHR
jgi:hypothetical protein